MFQEGLQIIKNDVGELNLNYLISYGNYGWFLSNKANKYKNGVICSEKVIFLSQSVFGEADSRFNE